MERQQRLLENYIRLLLKEDGEDSTGNYVMGGYTAYTDTKGLENIFFGPLKNVFKVAEGESKKILSSAKLALKIAGGVLKNMIPGLEANYGKMFKVHKEQIDTIEKNYADFYKGAFSILESPDLAIATFLWNPGLFMVGKVAIGSNGTTKKISELLSSTKKKDNSYEEYKGWLDYKASTQKKSNRNKENTQSNPEISQPTPKQPEPKTESLNYVRSLVKTILLEQAENVPQDISNASNNYRKNFEEQAKKIVDSLNELKDLNDDAFIQKYAKGLGDTESLYKQADAQLKKAKEKKVDASKSSSDEVVKMIESKKKDIVARGKNSLKQAHLQKLEEQKKNITKQLSDISKSWNVNVDPTSHGQVVVIDKIIDNIKKVKV